MKESSDALFEITQLRVLSRSFETDDHAGLTEVPATTSRLGANHERNWKAATSVVAARGCV